MFERLDVPIIGVVENMAHYTCTACGHKEHIFGSEAFEQFLQSRKLSLLTRIPLAKEIRELSDSGSPVVLSDTEMAQPYRALASYIREQCVEGTSLDQPQKNILIPEQPSQEQFH